ncbi:MAG: transporter substrate-binding domain-containing protein [Neisseriaceae bacterium]|nr:transporter substrate-binding domain-containing protein [Neisseriaceae bacterium]
MWKKLLQVCLLGVALTACNVEKTETQSVQPAQPAPEEKVLRVGTHAKYAPFETIENKELVGFDIDLIKAMGEMGGFKVEIHSLAWEGLFDTLDTGLNDAVVAAVTITPERAEKMDFTNPYFEVSQMVLTNHDDIQSYADLKDKRVGVLKGGQTGNLNREALTQHAYAVMEYESLMHLAAALKSDEIDAFVSDNAAIENYLNTNEDNAFHSFGDVRLSDGVEQYGIAVRKGNEETLKMLNNALYKVRESGQYYEIHDKYFKPKPKQETTAKT